MRTPSVTVDAYHLQAMVERLQREGLSEREIVAAVEEADDRHSGPARKAPRWSQSRRVRTRRSR